MTGVNLLLRYLEENKNRKITPGDISKDLNLSTARVATVFK